jgi:hypothetical protein
MGNFFTCTPAVYDSVLRNFEKISCLDNISTMSAFTRDTDRIIVFGSNDDAQSECKTLLKDIFQGVCRGKIMFHIDSIPGEQFRDTKLLKKLPRIGITQKILYTVLSQLQKHDVRYVESDVLGLICNGVMLRDQMTQSPERAMELFLARTDKFLSRPIHSIPMRGAIKDMSAFTLQMLMNNFNNMVLNVDPDPEWESRDTAAKLRQYMQPLTTDVTAAKEALHKLLTHLIPTEWMFSYALSHLKTLQADSFSMTDLYEDLSKLGYLVTVQTILSYPSDLHIVYTSDFRRSQLSEILESPIFGFTKQHEYETPVAGDPTE